MTSDTSLLSYASCHHQGSYAILKNMEKIHIFQSGKVGKNILFC